MATLLPKDYWTFVAFVVPLATLYACMVDFREHRVPNWLNGALAAAGILARATYEGWAGVGTALLGLLVGFGVLIIPWAMHAMGAGDVKLMAAIGAWFGPSAILAAFVVGTLVGGVIAVIMILAARKQGHALINLGTILNKCSSVRTAFSDYGSVKSFGSTTTLLPYGIPLTVGALTVLTGKLLEWPVLT